MELHYGQLLDVPAGCAKGSAGPGAVDILGDLRRGDVWAPVDCKSYSRSKGLGCPPVFVDSLLLHRVLGWRMQSDVCDTVSLEST